MILKYEDYKYAGFTVFERVVFQSPFKPSVTYDQEACFIYSLSGNGVSYGGLEQDEIVTGQSILMKCGSFVNHWQYTDDGAPCEIVAIHINPDLLSVIYKNNLPDFLHSNTYRSNKIFQKIPANLVIDEFIKGLLFYFDNPSLITEQLIELKVKELILLLYNIDYNNLRNLLKSLFLPVDMSFKSIVEAHLFEELEITDYAALTNTSLSTFKRKFKQIYKLPPATYIIDKRLEQAAKLLTKTDQRITEISFNCGFKELSTFSRSFTKKYGTAPSRYRRNSRSI